MQKISLLLCLLILTSCGKNPLSPAAMISFQAGSSANALQNSSVSSLFLKTQAYVNPQQFSMTINRIDISANGEKWETILNTPAEFQINGNQIHTVEISKGIPISEDEYHGIRFWISKVVWQSNVINISNIAKGLTLGYGSIFPFSNPVEYSTKNGYLNSFRTSKNSSTYIVFNISLNEGSEEGYFLATAVRTTRF